MLDTGRLNRITTFPALIEYLRDQLDWPIAEENFQDLTYDWDPAEFGLSTEAVGQIEIKQLRPIEREPWGIFFLSLPQKKLPITVLRRILGGLAVKKRASANAAERAAWNKDDLLFIAAHGAGQERSLAFAHFHEDKDHGDLPSLKVLGWDEGDTIRRLSDTHRTLKEKLHWRDRGEDDAAWRSRWNEAFRERPGESIATSKALAQELARLAREIRRRANELLVVESDKGPLRTLHKAFKEALIHDLNFDDFADMYAQTIAYGLLAASISRESGALVADNAADLAPPTNPFLKELLQTFLSAGGRKGGMDFDELGVNDVVEMLRLADMHAVLLDFDTKNPSEDPVIHFYELFLKEYDPKKRMQRGVFYTPRPVVSFIVRSVDEILRTEFDLEDGLASTETWAEVIAKKPEIKLPRDAKGSDPFVRVLDPATGTGTFLVEVIDLIHQRMTEKWRSGGRSANDIEALWNEYVPKYLLPRLYGFELMMAPYAIAHMKLGLKLAETGYHFGSGERARIFLTNALEPAQDFNMQLAFMSEALAHEAQAANHAKEVRTTVVIGNPPYAGHSANPSRDSSGRLTHAGELVRPYFFLDGKPLGERNPKWLNNDYVKFLAFAESQIARTGVGALGFITSNSWLDSPTFRGVRASMLTSFSSLNIIDLFGNADSKDEQQLKADDENVFDIKEGVNITIGQRGPSVSQPSYAGLVGPREGPTGKFAQLMANSLHTLDAILLCPTPPMRMLKRQRAGQDENYEGYPALTEIFPNNVLGYQTHRDELVIRIDRKELESNLDRIMSAPAADLVRVAESLNVRQSDGWSLAAARKRIGDEPDRFIIPSAVRPFDTRACLYHPAFVDRPRPLIRDHIVGRKNLVLNASRQLKEPGYRHVLVSELAPESCLISDRSREGNYTFPLWLRSETSDQPDRANLNRGILAKMAASTGLTFSEAISRGDLKETFGPRDVFDWIYAVLHSPSYRSSYADYLKSDFARIPVTGSNELFQRLTALGTKLVALHLLDVEGERELKDPQSVRFAGHGEARVEHAPQWSPAGGNRVTISSHRWFEGVPERVWNFHVGGYQPAQKWLKDRAARGGKKKSPSRVLTADDQLHYRRMIVAMDTTIDLMAEIDRVIEKHGGWPDAFKGMREGDQPHGKDS